jgi:hypothetical protein
MVSGVNDFANRAQVDRRLRLRVATDLSGRYMLANRRERLCTIVDASSSGLSLVAPDQGEVGETVIVYIDQMGRVEGQIVRHTEVGFAIKFKGGPSRATEALGRLVEQRRLAH